MVRVSGGSSTRRRGGAVSLSSADVPSISSGGDPGVRAEPGLGGEIGKGLQTVGRGLEDASALLFQRIKRDEGLARDRDDVTFSGETAKTLRGLQDVGDFSDQAVLDQGATMRQRMDEILENHEGREGSRERLKIKLEQRFNAFTDSLAIFNVTQTNKQEKAAVDGRIAGRVGELQSDPDLVLADPLAAFIESSEDLDDDFDLLGLDGPRREVFEKTGRAELALAALGPLIGKGQTQEAKDFLNSEEVRAVLDGPQLRGAAERILKAEGQIEDSEVDELFDMAKRLAGPGATEKQILLKANELKGVAKENNIRWVMIGGKAYPIDNDTQQLAGPAIVLESDKEAATRAGAIKDAENLADRRNMDVILEGLDVDPLTVEGVQASITGQTTGETAVAAKEPPSGTGEARQPAAVSPLGDKEEALSTSLTDEDLRTPLGVDREASVDAQRVATLIVSADRLFKAGKDSEASFALRMAQTIADNSKAMQEQKELDARLSDAIIRDLKLPVGSRVRDALGEKLPTDVEKAVELARETELEDFVTLDEAGEFNLLLGTTNREAIAIFKDRKRRGVGPVPRTPAEEQKELELNRLAPVEMQREFALPPGTTIGEGQAIIEHRELERQKGKEGATLTRGGAAGRTVARSQEEVAQATSFGAKEGQAKSKALETLGFVSEATGLILDVLVEHDRDPTILGGAGKLRATGRNVVTLLGDLGADVLVDFARNISENENFAIVDNNDRELSQEEVKAELGIDSIGALFDNKVLGLHDILSNAIGLVLARVQTPAGRIPVELIKRSISDASLVGFTGEEVIADRIKAVLDRFRRRRFQLRERHPDLNLRDPSDSFDKLDMEAFAAQIGTGLTERTRQAVEAERVEREEQGLDVEEETLKNLPPGVPQFRIDPETRTLVPVEPQQQEQEQEQGSGAQTRPGLRGPITQEEVDTARDEAEERFPFIAQFDNVMTGPSKVPNKGGLGEFVEPDNPDNPFQGQFAITIDKESRNLQGGIADTIVADMVHAAGQFSPEFQGLKQELINSFGKGEVALARRRFKQDFEGKFTGSNFENFDNFLNNFWVEGVVQHLLIEENSEIEEFKRSNPESVEILERILELFESEEVLTEPIPKAKTKVKERKRSKSTAEEVLETIEKGGPLSEAEEISRRGGV